MKPFKYYEVSTLKETIEILSSEEDVRILAGGCGILLLMKQKIYFPKALVNIKKIPGLSYIQLENGEIKIGALTTLNEAKTSYILQENIPIMTEALDYVATDRIRNMATLGGSLAHADPNSDVAPPLLALEGRVRVIGLEGEREISLESFFRDYYETVLNSTDVLKEIVIPIPNQGVCSFYTRFQVRKAMDKPMPAVAICLNFEEDCKTIRQARISLSGVGKIPLRLKEGEEYLKGKQDHPEVRKRMASIVKERIDPVGEFHYSVEYKKEMAGIFLNRAFEEACKRAHRLKKGRARNGAIS